MVLTSSLDELMEDQTLQYYQIVLTINDRDFKHAHTLAYIYIYIDIYRKRESMCL